MNLDDFKKVILDDEVSNSQIITMFIEVLETNSSLIKDEAWCLMQDYRPVAARVVGEMVASIEKWQSGK